MITFMILNSAYVKSCQSSLVYSLCDLIKTIDPTITTKTRRIIASEKREDLTAFSFLKEGTEASGTLGVG